MVLPLSDGETLTDESVSLSPSLRRTDFGEFLGSLAGLAFERTTPAQIFEQASRPRRVLDEREKLAIDALNEASIAGVSAESLSAPESKRLTKAEFEANPNFREAIPFREGMTEERLAALAQSFDLREYRRSLVARGRGGFVREALGFGTSLVASIPDPVNFVPLLGPATRAAAVARFGRVGGRTLASAADASIATALIEPFISASLAESGDESSFSDVLLDIVLGGAIGGIFGTGVGLLALRRDRRALRRAVNDLSTIAERDAQGEALDKAVGDILLGEDVNVSGLAGRAFDSPRARLNATTSLTPPGSRLDTLLPEELRTDTLSAAEVGARLDTEDPKTGQSGTLVPLVNRQGELRVFNTEREAKTAANKLRGDVKIVLTEDGRFVLARRKEVEFVRESDGEVKVFANKRQALRFRDTNETLKGRRKGFEPVNVAQPGRPGFVLARGLGERGVKGIEASPGTVQFGRATGTRTTTPGSVPRAPIAGERSFATAAPEPPAPKVREAEARREKDTGEVPIRDFDQTEEGEAITSLRADGALTRSEEAALDAAEAQVRKADQFAEAAKIAARCIARGK